VVPDLSPNYTTSLPTSPARGSAKDFSENLDAWLDGASNQQEYPNDGYAEEGYTEPYDENYDPNNEDYNYEGTEYEGYTNEEYYAEEGYDYEGYAQGNEGAEEGYGDQNYYAYDNTYYDNTQAPEVVNNTNQNV